MLNDLSFQELIQLGAKTLVVPGNLPIGCVPKYLMVFKSDKEEDYEPHTGCLRWMNKFSRYHNKLLMKKIKKLRKLHHELSSMLITLELLWRFFFPLNNMVSLDIFPFLSTRKFSLYFSFHER
jgi:hypothetical protein